ncbi:hypothetical protein TIFTF001_027649 [Ficus carica]|uniref:Chalcone synthase n=1 Tax=Ficus carica TaxID=3494 RepID=A0AA88APT8_FICCA|nr:hypothetical protein TIFTF001_025962 [Ficus carica]GMN58555.1 hypothetical protein TIFTF001_027649 [Ficus carica]
MATLSVGESQAVIRQAQDVATILAIGTVNPFNFVYQADYPDFYFRITNSEEKTTLKEKFKRICAKSMIRKRHMHLTEEILKENPNIGIYDAPSLDARQDIKIVETPKLGVRAAKAAIKEWGQPKTNITHLIFDSTSGVDMPGADYQLIKSLGLKTAVKRVMLYHQGCFAGGTVLRIAKDLAENNPGSGILIVCSDITVFTTFRGPPTTTYLVLWAKQSSATTQRLSLSVRTYPTRARSKNPCSGSFQRRKQFFLNPKAHSRDIYVKPFGISDWNSLFWVAHPGGAAILREIELKIGLKKEKLRATWHVLSEYGNMSSASVLFILDEMRKKSLEDGKSTTGEGLKWGVLFGFGPGLTVETVVLQSAPAVS